MTVTYTNSDKVSARIQGEYTKPVLISAASGVSQSNKDEIYLNDTSQFTVADNIRITDDSEVTGEDLIVSSITADTKLVTTTSMTKDYTTGNNGQVQILSMFDKKSHPTRAQVEDLINENESYIDEETGHAWQSKTVTREYHDLRGIRYTYTGHPIKLHHRSIKDFNGASGDKLEVWNGSSWVDWEATKTEGRANDFWINYEHGILYLRAWYFPYHIDAVRVTYRYGETSVPGDIQKCCTLLTAADVLDMENYVAHIPAGDLNIIESTAKQRNWREIAKRIIDTHRELPHFH